MDQWERKQRRIQKEKMIQDYELEKQGADQYNKSTRNGKGHRKMKTNYQLEDSQRSKSSGENTNEFDDIIDKKNSQSLYENINESPDLVLKQNDDPVIDTDMN